MPEPMGQLVTPVVFDAVGCPRSLAQVWGYTATYAEHRQATGVPAGLNALDFSVCPEGEVWILTAAMLSNPNTIACFIRLIVYNGSTRVLVYNSRFLPVTRVVNFSGFVVVGAGWWIRAEFVDCAAGDGIYADVTGYKMRL